MKMIRLKSGKYLLCRTLEITGVPEIDSFNQSRKISIETNTDNFKRIIQDLHRYAEIGQCAIELLWAAKPEQGMPYEASIHLFLVLRIIGNAQNELEHRGDVFFSGITTHLQTGFFSFKEIEVDELRSRSWIPGISCNVNAVVKSEKMVVHSRSVMPYYYSSTLERGEGTAYQNFTKALSHCPGAAVSFQLFSTMLTMQENMAIMETASALHLVAGGIGINGGGGGDQRALPALDVMNRLVETSNGNLFTYNILVFGNETQCVELTSQTIGLLQNAGNVELDTVNLNRERIDLHTQFAYYPWNINRKLVSYYRKRSIIPYIPAGLIRIPYLVTTDEAISFFNIPLNDMNLTGMPRSRFARNDQNINPLVIDPQNIQFGTMADNARVIIGCPPKILTKHALVVGKPGTGKTTFSLNLLLQLWHTGVPFLAVEPTKSEYRALINCVQDLQVFTPGRNDLSPFVINPFLPPTGITVEQYIPSLYNAFSAAFSMPSPLDSFFQAAMQETYVQYGWRNQSTADDPRVTAFGLHEFILVFKKMIEEASYSQEVKGNLNAAGVMRLMNLINQNPNIYDTVHSVPLEDMLAKPTVLELNAIDNQEQKAVLMALLLINVCVYTKHCQLGDGKLKNAILIDEAHVLFGAKDHHGDHEAEGAGTTVKALENMLAEIRSYGTSIVIADQSPAAVGANVTKNTEVKVVFQLVDAQDRQMISSSTNMTSVQEAHIAKLGVGEAFVSYGLLDEPVQINTPDIREENNIPIVIPDEVVRKKMTYWNQHPDLLIPFIECKYSKGCTKCEGTMRTEAMFWSSRFYQLYGKEMTDVKKVCGYLRAIDGWLTKKVDPKLDSLEFHNCVKIRVLRKAAQNGHFYLTEETYRAILEKYVNRWFSLQEDASSSEMKHRGK